MEQSTLDEIDPNKEQEEDIIDVLKEIEDDE